MAYASSSDVAGLVKNLVSGACDFTASTSPTLAQVTAWLSGGCAIINATIQENNYGAIPLTSPIYDYAVQMNATYAAYRAELSRTNARESPGARTRSDLFKKEFDDSLKYMKGLDLSKLSVPLVIPSNVYAGGVSVSDKAIDEADVDRVTPRFNRGQFANPQALTPQGGLSGCSSGNP